MVDFGGSSNRYTVTLVSTETPLKQKTQTAQTLHSARIVASFALVGAVVAGTFFGWLPALGLIGVHEIGAAVGAAVGVVANIKHLV